MRIGGGMQALAMNTSPKIRRGWGALVIVGVAACSGAGFDDAVPGEPRDDGPNVEVSSGAQTQDNAATPPPPSSTPVLPTPSNDAGAPKIDAAPPPDPGIPGPFDGGWIPPLDFDGGFIPNADGGYKPPKPPKTDGGFAPKLDAGITGPFDGSFLPF
jgi:hypothetical protein